MHSFLLQLEDRIHLQDFLGFASGLFKSPVLCYTYSLKRSKPPEHLRK